jgi:hypothetical protein
VEILYESKLFPTFTLNIKGFVFQLTLMVSKVVFLVGRFSFEVVLFSGILGLLFSQRRLIVRFHIKNVSFKIRYLLSKVSLSLQLYHDFFKRSNIISRNHGTFTFFLQLFILVVEAHQGAIISSGEDKLIIMSDGHSLDCLGVSLDFADFVEGVLDEVDSSRLVLLSNTSEHSSSALGSNELGVHDALVVAYIFLTSITEVAGVVRLGPSVACLFDLTDALVTSSSVNER